MKASELNGTHLGQRITFTENGVTATARLSRIDHAGQNITDHTAMMVEQQVLGRRWVHLEFLGGMQANVTPAAEVTIHDHPETAKPKAQHWLTEDHNTDPVCACGWRPESMWPKEKPATWEDGREMVRRHIRATQTNTGHPDDDR